MITTIEWQLMVKTSCIFDLVFPTFTPSFDSTVYVIKRCLTYIEWTTKCRTLIVQALEKTGTVSWLVNHFHSTYHYQSYSNAGLLFIYATVS